MTEKPDFEALKRERAEQVKADLRRIYTAWGYAPEQMRHVHVHQPGTSDQCYCDCLNGGPCQHEFDGWRDFADGRGGERVCQRCGMGAMAHSLGTCWE
jgi:hypothetical protein